MSQITRAQLIEAVGQMSVMELCTLIAELEMKWDVSAMPEPATRYPWDDSNYFKTLLDEQTEFGVLMTSFGSNKIAVIKAVRGITSLGLKEAKELVESAPCEVVRDLDRQEAEQIVSRLVEAGAEAEVQ